jgi:hypothetical protein
MRHPFAASQLRRNFLGFVDRNRKPNPAALARIAVLMPMTSP